MDSQISAMSHPWIRFDESFWTLITREYSASLIELFLERFRALLSANASSILSLVESARNDKKVPLAVTGPTLGLCLDALTNESDTLALQAVAAMSFDLASNGEPVSWSVSVPVSRQFFWGTAAVLPALDYYGLQSDGTSASLRVSNGASKITGNLHLIRHGDGSWTGDTITLLPRIDTPYGAITLITKETAGKELLERSRFQLLAANRLDITLWNNAFSNLKQNSLQYYDWVTRALRWLVLVDSEDGRTMMSASNPHLPGLAYVSHLNDFLSLGEMLVHEASHQYFNAISSLGDIADPKEPRLYYSPFVNSLRPLDRIALAYHAFANVYLFYRSYPKPIDPKGIAARSDRTLSDLRAIEQFLIENPSLMDLGNALIQPLLKAVQNEC